MTMSDTEIGNYLEELDSERKSLKQNIFELMWWMRGSVTLEEAWAMSADDRRAINEVIKNNLETTKKSGLNLI